MDLASSANYGSSCTLLRINNCLGLSLRLCLSGLQSQTFYLIHYCRQVLVPVG